jgi:serine/threonine protein kinase
MAPEIASGGKADARTTVYALGVLMYELATGRPPFRGDSFISPCSRSRCTRSRRRRARPCPSSEIPEVFEAVVARALAKAPGDRFTDLRALDEALLAARAREGELRRVTQILALDPAFWDEDGSRRIKAPSAPQRAAVDPTPLATFAADLKQNQPELAAAVFGRHDPRPRAEPSTSTRLTQLAPPVTAPELPPLPVVPEAAPQMPVLVLSRPPGASSSLFRTVSLSIVAASVLLMLSGPPPRGRPPATRSRGPGPPSPPPCPRSRTPHRPSPRSRTPHRPSPSPRSKTPRRPSPRSRTPRRPNPR